jgi:hypothetical protein
VVVVWWVWGCGGVGCVVVWVGVLLWGCGGVEGVVVWGCTGVVVWGVSGCRAVGVCGCGGCGGCGAVWWCGGDVGVGGGFPLRSNIPRSALCATLDTYNFNKLINQ